MPDIVRGAPDAGTYNYVVARWNWSPTQTYSVANYGETRKTRVVPWPEDWPLPDGKGNPNTPTRAKPDTVMAFLNDRYLRDRCQRLGWHDITEQWFARLGHPDHGPMPPLPVLDSIPGEVLPVPSE